MDESAVLDGRNCMYILIMIGDISSYFVSTYFPVQTAKNNILYNGRKKI